jgi:hypothetical protein
VKTKQLDLDYFIWLISQIDTVGSRTYNELFERMHNTEFVWIIPNDDNRLQDGLDLRVQFMHEVSEKSYPIDQAGATVLEVLIGLSRRVAFAAGGLPSWWAWRLMENLRLQKASDPLTTAKSLRVDNILDALIWRTYERNGQGGFFPLNNSVEDQTKCEIWYQMNEYVMEIVES